MQLIQDNLVVILMFLLSLSEVLALIPAVKANSVFQLIVNIIKSVLPASK